MRFAKGHGTGNDFVVLPDPAGELDLPAELVRRLCDRRTGIGADGVLRAAPAGQPASPAGDDPPGGPPRWFMDYRNADGSVAEMCGNGIRVFVRYLLEAGLAEGPDVPVATRAGVRVVHVCGDGQLRVGIGPALAGQAGWAVLDGRTYQGVAVTVGNPHLACAVTEPVARLDLTRPPVVDRDQFPDGVNVEFFRVTGPRRIEMRVHERGSGATLSCGTGAVAAAAAAARGQGLAAAGQVAAGGPDAAAAGQDPAQWTVEVPGGRLLVIPDEAASMLTGPAVLVADGTIRPGWLAGA
jgi:diaminopimelate epimerase